MPSEIMPVMGEYRYTIDAKNRLFIPAKHREALGETLVIYPNLRNDSLRICSVDEWRETVEKISRLPAQDREELLSYFNKKGDTFTPDSQGRVTLNQSLVDHAGLSGQVVIIGCGRNAAIWSAEKYDGIDDSAARGKLAELADRADVF